MSTLSLGIKHIKNIAECMVDFSFDRGVYAIVGGNGSGKSSIMQCLSILVKPSSIYDFKQFDYTDESEILINIDGNQDIHNVKKKKSSYSSTKNNLIYRGFYEGSIFFGTRFHNQSKLINMPSLESIEEKIVDADQFVKDSLSQILHGDKTHYRTLKKIKNKRIAKDLGFEGVPYFFEHNGNIISQFNMSSGECMLISLFDFIYSIIFRKNYNSGEKIVLLIDEVELALHPSAIDRLISFFNELISNDNYELIVYLSTHSAEVIQQMSPKRIYMIENDNGIIDVINPCYPNYAVRNLYVPNGYDYLILVEDELAKIFVEKTIRDNNLCKSKLFCVLPSGGADQLVSLHKDILQYKILGVGKKLISIYDGDVAERIAKKKDYEHLPKAFIPIKSIEKFIKKKFIIEKDKNFIKLIGDKYFTQKSLNEIISEYIFDPRSQYDKNGKKLYDKMLKELENVKISENEFIKSFCEDITNYIPDEYKKFAESLSAITTDGL